MLKRVMLMGFGWLVMSLTCAAMIVPLLSGSIDAARVPSAFDTKPQANRIVTGAVTAPERMANRAERDLAAAVRMLNTTENTSAAPMRVIDIATPRTDYAPAALSLEAFEASATPARTSAASTGSKPITCLAGC